MKRAQEKVNQQKDEGTYSDPEKKAGKLGLAQSLNTEGFKSTFKNRTRNNVNNPGIVGGSLQETQLSSLNGQLSNMLSDQGQSKPRRSHFANSALGNIQKKISEAIRQSHDVQPREVPKDIPKIQEIKPARTFEAPKIQEYKPIASPLAAREVPIFKDSSFRLNNDFLKPQQNHLEAYNK